MSVNRSRLIRPDRRILMVLALLAALPVYFASNYVLSVGVVIGLYALVATGLNLLMGHAGQVSLGQAAFFGIGAYASALISLKLGVSPWLSLLAATLLGALCAYVIGAFTLRLSGHYLALATLGFGIIAWIFMVEAGGLTGGPSGLVRIPSLQLGTISLAKERHFYVLVWLLVLGGLAIYQNVVVSRVGLALRAIHGSEYAASALGVYVWREKLQVFTLSAAYAALAGGLYAHYIGFISPTPFGFAASIEFVVAGVVGGLASAGGPVVGAAVVVVLSQGLKDLLPRLLPGAGGEVEIMVHGVILILILILMPEGVSGRVERLLARLSRRRKAGGEGREAA